MPQAQKSSAQSVSFNKRFKPGLQAFLIGCTGLVLSACGGGGSADAENMSAATSSAADAANEQLATVPRAKAHASNLALVTVGNLRWHFGAEPPADKRQAITKAMNFAINNANTVARYHGDVEVFYNPAVPTADGSYNQRIRFGQLISPGVAVHELGHYLGSVAFDSNPNVSRHRYVGPLGVARLQAYDGPDAVLHVDRMHFWPYGWNHSNEYVAPQREIGMVSAIRGDMGLPDGMSLISGTYRIQNRLSGLLLGSKQGAGPNAPVRQYPDTAGADLVWTLTSKNGFVSLANQATGRYVDSMKVPFDGGYVQQTDAASTDTTTLSQQWEIVPTQAGNFNLVNRSSGKCLDTGGAIEAGSEMSTTTCNSGARSMQWHFVR